ncbi:MAG: hypothetical protein MI861_04280, partial [Pirellulales bacterium]|nr:hypothetical protein [Pirellulales bacterium]
PVQCHTIYPPPRYRPVHQYVDRFGGYWALSNILYGNSSRYQANPGRRNYRCVARYNPTQPQSPPDQREESYPQLWDQTPELLVRLLRESRCECVHDFAAQALRANHDYCRQLEIDVLLALLSAPYRSTCSLAFDLAVERYDSTNPDLKLVLALANCSMDAARNQSHRWIETQRALYFSDLDFVYALITSVFADTRAFARDSLRIVGLHGADAQAVALRCLEFILTLGQVESDNETAADIGTTLLEAFSRQLREIDPRMIERLLTHPHGKTQWLGGELILQHRSLANRPPAELLQVMIHSDHGEVRQVAIRIIDQLSAGELTSNVELLLALIRHAQSDVRDQIRPTVRRLAAGDRQFASRLALQLVDALLVAGAPEGVPSHTANVLQEDLANDLDGVSSATVWKLLQSRSIPAQDIGGMLLTTNVNANSLSVEELVKLASHDVLSVREACWSMCRQEIGRLRKAMASAVRLLDAKWEDSREFGFELFRDQFSEADLTPAVLVSICDSVREDVQQFGRELITRRFEEEHGQEYLLKLSEHPSAEMQLFATSFLDRYATDQPQRLAELEPYFLSVLSRVNKARVAKDRILALLRQEAGKNEEAAVIVARIIGRISATSAIGDLSSAIEMMVDLRQRYPHLEVPLSLEPVEVR